MTNTREAVIQLRARAAQLLSVAKTLDHLDKFVMTNLRPKHSRPRRRKLSRAARLKISVAQKKRWAKVRGRGRR